MEMAEIREAATGIESILRLQSYPLAVKMLRSEDEIPEGAKRPLRDLGHRLSTCQVFSLSRRQGMSLAQMKEDMWCVEPVLGFGMAEPPEYFLEGNNRYPGTASTLEAGRTWAQSFPRLPVGEYAGFVSAPAGSANFVPDLLVIYCDPSQLTQLLIARNWMDGVDQECKLSGHAACVYAVAPTVSSGQWQITSPCRGDRARAMARDDEMIASIPTSDIPAVLEGLLHVQRGGGGLPLALSLRPEYDLPPSYVEIGKMIGMDWVR
jgi:uncharacterized protein (DUF169 family)